MPYIAITCAPASCLPPSGAGWRTTDGLIPVRMIFISPPQQGQHSAGRFLASTNLRSGIRRSSNWISFIWRLLLGCKKPKAVKIVFDGAP